jgi:glyoxylase-like metal-dependent hydrolase (beta-lactamase superfamily II)
MKVRVIQTGYFKLDGGAMFGIVPKRLWTRLNPPDEQNLCTWAMRCLLVETDHRKILIDTGIGDKQDAKFRSHFAPFGEDTLLKSLAKQGIEPQDITDVILTHLHFDHCGGALYRNEANEIVPTFPNAVYWSNEKHWNWAMNPNQREQASFLKENFVPLQTAGVLQYIKVRQYTRFCPEIKILFTYGHTEAMMLPYIKVGDKTIVYCADTLPSSYHVGMPYIMSYDIRPLDTLNEKNQLLEQAADEGHILFFEHDPVVECATVKRNEQGRIILNQTFKLAELFQ